MTEVLVYGFEPFDILKENPSQIIAEELGKRENIETLIFPSKFSEVEKIEGKIRETRPSKIIGIGTDPDNPRIQIKKVALNIIDSSSEDEDGINPSDETISSKGRTAYRSSLDTERLKEVFKNNNVPVKDSYHADTYVCNAAYYHSLRYIDKKNLEISAGFIHVPLHPKEVNRLETDSPSFPADDITKALNIYLNKP